MHSFFSSGFVLTNTGVDFLARYSVLPPATFSMVQMELPNVRQLFDTALVVWVFVRAFRMFSQIHHVTMLFIYLDRHGHKLLTVMIIFVTFDLYIHILSWHPSHTVIWIGWLMRIIRYIPCNIVCTSAIYNTNYITNHHCHSHYYISLCSIILY